MSRVEGSAMNLSNGKLPDPKNKFVMSEILIIRVILVNSSRIRVAIR